MAKKNETFVVRYSYGTGRNFGKAKNTSKSLKSFRSLFRKPMVTSERFKDYMKMNDKDQGHLKSVNGWFYRTQVDGPVRNRGSGLPSDLITLDLDYATPDFLEELLGGRIMPGLEWFLHTSRRHTSEKPRIRLFIFLEKPVPNDLYGPVSRIIAQHFDPDMQFVDKVSFRPAQMMFMPTISKDGEFVFHENNGDLLDWSEMLDVYELSKGDWRDITQLPQVEGENARVVEEKAEDPTEKGGIVGNFCRAYNVMEAIEAFELPYEEVSGHGGKVRYTFLGGTTTNGAEVQDDGLFLYSHHGSDPCSDMLVNAFDLVRIHKFGELDEKFDHEGKPMSQRPSFKALIEHLKDDENYRKEQLKSRYDESAMSDFDDIADEGGFEPEIDEDYDPEIDFLSGAGDTPPPKPKPKKVGDNPFDRPVRPKAEKGWMTALRLDQNGNIISNLPNVSKILDSDGRTRNSLGFNEHMGEVVLIRPLDVKLPYVTTYPVRDKINGEMWTDMHRDAIRHFYEEANGPGLNGYNMRPSLMDIRAATNTIAHRVNFHPIKEYLNFWKDRFESGGSRSARSLVESLFIDYCGSPDDAYHRMIALKFMLACVARVFEPGHKFDYSPILHGDQGARKSTFIAILAQHWFGELSADFSNPQKLVEQMQGCWIMEIPELSSIGRSQIEDVKAFLSGTFTKVRMAYAERAGRYMRQQCFMGSTNDAQFLQDTTGNRRWWPVAVSGLIDTDKFRQNVGMFWGAAMVLYLEMREEQPEGFLPLALDDPKVRAQAEAMQSAVEVETDIHIMAQRILPTLEKKIMPFGVSDFDKYKPGRIKRILITHILDDIPELLRQENQATLGTKIGKALRMCGWYPHNKERFADGREGKPFKPGPEVLARWEAEDKANAEILNDDDLI